METEPDPTHVQICDAVVIKRHDLRTTHEEADVCQIILDLLAAHVISKCDAVVYLCGICKVKVLKALTVGNHPKMLGNLQMQMTDMIAETTCFNCCLLWITSIC